MPRRVNPILLLGLIIALVLSFGVLASAQLAGGPSTGVGETSSGDPSVGGTGSVGAQPAGGTASDAIGVGEAQLGKPHVYGADGPDAFSCAGLIRYILRTINVDPNAPWSPEGYLGTYPAVDPANLQPGDVVIYPNWATMYVGNGMLLSSDEAVGYVTETPMSQAGIPEGIVRPPYGGQSQGTATPPAAQQQGSGAADPQTQPAAQPLSGAADPQTQQPPAQQVSDGSDPQTQQPPAQQGSGATDPQLMDGTTTQPPPVQP